MPSDTQISGRWLARGLPLAGLVMLIGGLALIANATLYDQPAIESLDAWLTMDVLVVAIIALVFVLTPVRTLVLLQSEVIFVVGWRRNHIPWNDIVPPTRPGLFGLQFKLHSAAVDNISQGYLISRAQARALLEHPSCPKMDLSPRVRRFVFGPPPPMA